ncbi:MAG TPA: class II fructose-bisphosphate aldolase [Gemmataceae bacterium]|nr:class II fructose-bisphosphate aldolase [Gemmataceae bacterium]
MVTLREALHNANTRHVALGHFNVSDLSGFHAVVRAARRLSLPVMVGVSEGEREFIGVKEIALLVRMARDEYGLPLYLNADHTHSLAVRGRSRSFQAAAQGRGC